MSLTFHHLTCLLAFILCCLLSTVEAASKPNVLLIVSEDNGPELSCYGDEFAKTPHLDALAAEGIRFERAFVPQAGCSQSRASFLTGLYPHQHGQIGLATWGFRLYRKNTPNLPRSLKEIGYRTGIIGKLHINPESAFPFDLHEIRNANFKRANLGEYAKHAEDFFNVDDSPFFLSINYPDAHDPWIRQIEGLPEHPLTPQHVQIMSYMGIKSEAFRAMVADYYNCMSRLDALVGTLLEALERSGKADNTIVIYIGDHGADMLRGKRTCYEGGLRIPFLLRWRERIEPQVRQELVSTLDLMPTLLAACGAAPVEDLPGDELQPLFAPGAANWRTHFCAEYHTHAAAPNYFPQRSVRNDRYKLIESLLPDTVHPDYENTIRKLHGDHAKRHSDHELDLHAVIKKARSEVRKAYATMRKPPRYQLYDLDQDPYEFRNLADSPEHSDVLKKLKQHLNEWRTATNDPLVDPKKLEQLTAEVQSMKKKTASRKHRWKYPEYLLAP